MNYVKCVTMYLSHIYKNPDLGRYSTVLYFEGKDIPLLTTLGELKEGKNSRLFCVSGIIKKLLL